MAGKFKKAACLMVFILGLGGTAAALVKTPDGAVLPDFDVRNQQQLEPMRELYALKATAGRKDLAESFRQGFFAPTAQQLAAVERLKNAGVPDLQVRWNRRTGLPHAVFSYSGYLTLPSRKTSLEVARSFLASSRELFGLTPEALDSMEVLGHYQDAHNGVTHIQMQQYVGGYPVFSGLIRFNLTPDNRIINAMSATPLPTLESVSTNFVLTPEAAILEAAGAIDQPAQAAPARKSPVGSVVSVYEHGPFLSDIQVRPCIFPRGTKGRPAYLVWLDSPGYPAYYQLIIDAETGELLHRYNMTSYVATDGRVFVHDPITDTFNGMIVTFPDSEVNVTAESPLGWVWEDPTAKTMGNNADAKLDREADNEQTIGFRASGQNDSGPPEMIHFIYPFTNKYEDQGQVGDASIACTNALYLAGNMHDYLYDLGFTEAAGNFQEVNLSPAGIGGDSVYMDVQDSADRGATWQTRNNANFSTPPDGSHPRGQFYLWMNPYPRRDSIFDAEVVQHEYSHGLSHRLMGGPNIWSGGCLTGDYGGAMGEGWSDFFPLSKGDDTALGEYTTGDAVNGIRSSALEGNTYDLCDFCQITFLGVPPGMCESHNNGEIWTAVLWDMRELLKAADPANGVRTAEQLVVDGMKLSPCEPTFNDMRDAILLSDQVNNAGANQCLIWQAFADRGMGVNSVILGVTDSSPVCEFTSPCDTGAGTAYLNASILPCSGQGTVSVTDSNAAGPLNVTLSSSAAGDTLSLSLPQSGSIDSFSASFDLAPDSGAPNPADSLLEVANNDTVTVQYNDSNPSQLVEVTATTQCAAALKFDYMVRGSSCAGDDTLAEFPNLRGFLDAGEVASFTVIIENPLEMDVHNARLGLATANPRVRILDPTPLDLGTIPGQRGTSPIEPMTATFDVVVSPRATVGETAAIDLVFTSDEFTTLATPSITVPLNKDYQLDSTSTPVESFEGSTNMPDDWGVFDWNPPSSEWFVVDCDAATGTNSFRNGAKDSQDCTSNYNEFESAFTYTEPYSFAQPGVIEEWRPTSISYMHKVDLGFAGNNADVMYVVFNELDPAGLVYDAVELLDPGANTGGAWVSHTVDLTGLVLDKYDYEEGIRIGWQGFRDQSSASTGTGYFIDDYTLNYNAARIVDQTTPCGNSYIGTLESCAAGATLSAYNTARYTERQYAQDGAFYLESPSDWVVLESEFPTPSMPGEVVNLIVSDNPDDGAHQGMLAVNGQTIASPKPALIDFGRTSCRPIPPPTPSATLVSEGSSLRLSWGIFPESGPEQVIIGYEVYRLNADTYPPATSTIDDYMNNGVLLGDTVGQANINEYQETAPQVNADTNFTYVIRPLFARAGGRVAAEFGDSETSAGKPNISTDSVIVTVEESFYVDFDFWKAERVEQGVKVTWGSRTEVQTDGFYVLKGSTPDESLLVPAHSLPITATGSGSTYAFLDTETAAGQTVYYQVLELTSAGEPSRTSVFTVESASRSIRRTRPENGAGLMDPSDSTVFDRSGRISRKTRR